MTFGAFLLSLRADPNRVSLCPHRLREALGMSRSAFVRLLGVHRNSLAGAAGWKAEQGIARVIRVLSAGHTLTRSVDRALLWFVRHPIPELGSRTPAELVAAGQADDVIGYANREAGR